MKNHTVHAAAAERSASRHKAPNSIARLWRLALLLPALALAACGSSQAVTATDAASTTLHRDGRWMVDSANRVVLLHGVNVVWKAAPYYPPDTAAGMTAADADFLAANGFNAVRLGVLFAGVMPTQGVIDSGYLDQIDRTVQLLASRHIRVLLDFHQDMYNEKYQGEGFPPWANYDDGLPNDAVHGFPLNEFASVILNHVYDNFWANKNNIWDDYRNAWIAVASRWRDQPYLLGYDIFNEPWPGTQWPTCFEIDCPLFDATLQKFQQYELAGIRSVDQSHFAFFEPQQLFDFGAPSGFGAITDPALGLSWHDYCSSTLTASYNLPVELPDCTIIEPRTMGNAATQTAAMGAASLMTEFGASDDLTDIGRVAQLADQNLVGWTYWSYKTFGDPTGSAQAESLFSNDSDLSTLKQAKAVLLIRPYAQAIAGAPTAMAFDTTSKIFTLSYTPRASTAPTQIFVPALQYPNGYTVNVSGGQVTSPAGASILTITNTSGAAQVSVEIDPVK
ncbi:MAG: cellulase family glycosylhydrolase [Stenotrophobium sp.]